MHREGINYPKFKDQFAAMDFEAEPMPVLSLFPMPSVTPLDDWEVLLTGAGGQRRLVCGRELRDLPVQRLRVPMVCQIFNWVERPEVDGVRLVDLLAATGIDSGESASSPSTPRTASTLRACPGASRGTRGCCWFSA